MATFNKSAKLQGVSYAVRGPVLEEANRLEAQGQKILKLNIGNPGVFRFEAPETLLEGLRQNLIPAEAYSDSRGIASAREAIAAYAAKKGIAGVTPNDVYTGNGVSELISICMQALLDPGDEILIPAPDYPLWTAASTLSGGRVVHYLCDETSDWQPDIEDMRRKISPKTKAIVVINPNNPTGALYGKEILEQIVSLARENGLIIFADEIYDRILMDGAEHTSIASLAPDVFCVTFNGLSKSHLVCGYRVGWMVVSGDKAPVKGFMEGVTMLSSMRLCANVPGQYAVKPALEDLAVCDEMTRPGGRIYEQLGAVNEELSKIDGLTFVKARAAFYVFPKLDGRFNITDDERFAIDLLRAKQVLIVHGTGFNWIEPNHFRIVCLPEAPVLREAVGRIGEFLAGYRQ
ncbi:MAG: pyridoxal phosphate-dependent aminotransferase [Oscillospiraceae bacterium]|jgi:alanine-synthesizing transaminase|nr:pyridoxal phosphate-dependent aminotransferase [Oscillospiraceae bacterium]